MYSNVWIYVVTVSSLTVAIDSSDVELYHELHRPKIHFSPERYFCNDPNGLVYFQGEYHMFYQYSQSATSEKAWGHALTTDLVHWENLPVALEPNDLGQMFSGSAVMDKKNSSGAQRGNETVMVAMFTQNDKNNIQRQSIAFSEDRGRTFTLYPGNPVIDNPGLPDFRDPKVRWHNRTHSWVAVIASGHMISFYNSKDLRHWEKTSDFVPTNNPGVAECPDLIPFETAEYGTLWVLLINRNPGGPNMGTGTQYIVGKFDGYKFSRLHPEESIVWLEYGPDSYAGVTWYDVPSSDGRTLFIAWMNTWAYSDLVPTDPWKGAMTVVRSLELKNTSYGYRLSSNPVDELYSLTTSVVYQGPVLVDTDEYPIRSSCSKFIGEFLFSLEVLSSDDFGVRLSNNMSEYVAIGFRKSDNIFYIDRSKSGDVSFHPGFANISTAPRFSDNKLLKMKLVADIASVEFFADDGLTVMTAVYFPTANFTSLSVFSNDGKVVLMGAKINQLTSIWDSRNAKRVLV